MPNFILDVFPMANYSEFRSFREVTVKISLKQRAFSFTHAFRGIGTLLRTQHNALIHLFATAAVVISGLLFKISLQEWGMLVISIVIVWVAEALNTAIEFAADAVTLEWDELIGKAKDVAASAVLVAAVGAALVGCIVFLPYIIRLFQ